MKKAILIWILCVFVLLGYYGYHTFQKYQLAQDRAIKISACIQSYDYIFRGKLSTSKVCECLVDNGFKEGKTEKELEAIAIDCVKKAQGRR